MSTLRVVRPSDSPVRDRPVQPSRASPPGWLLLLGAGVALVCGCILIWWLGTADTREIQALPDAQRIPLYLRTMENLTTVCDPAASRSMRVFCHNEAALALRFRECDSDPKCQEVARRHLPQPRR
jgi:hypothetical protein